MISTVPSSTLPSWLLVWVSACYLVGGISAGAYYPWLKSWLGAEQTHLFVERKYIASKSVHIATFAVVGLLLKAVSSHGVQPLYVYTLIFTVAFLCGLISSAVLLKIPAAPKDSCAPLPVWGQLRQMWQKEHMLFTAYVVSQFSFLFFFTFVPVFALKAAGLSVAAVMGLALLGQVGFVCVLPYYKRINEKKGALCSARKSMGGLCVLLGLLVAGWHFVIPQGLIWVSVILFFVGALTQAGVQAGFDAAVLLHAPQQNASVFFAMISWVKWLGAWAPLVAGLYWTLSPAAIEHVEPISAWPGFFILCAIAYGVAWMACGRVATVANYATIKK